MSQCDNLLLMRMNSQADLADLSRLFSFVPPGLMAGATSFRMGQALVAGKILPQAGYVQMGERRLPGGRRRHPDDLGGPPSLLTRAAQVGVASPGRGDAPSRTARDCGRRR